MIPIIYDSIDTEALRSELIDHFGAASPYEPMAMADVLAAERASADELIRLAEMNGIDPNNFKK
ncbi:MAG: hypothetical protein J6A37_15800 [Oscillospiraceae bacterium]|nr:hypothetical protein [Oscillospiraceae bacterium]